MHLTAPEIRVVGACLEEALRNSWTENDLSVLETIEFADDKDEELPQSMFVYGEVGSYNRSIDGSS